MAARIASLCTALVFLLSSSAHGALIDFGDFTRDTSTGLDWLLSPYDLESSGWTAATPDQICGLFAAYALAPSPCPNSSIAEAPGNASEALIDAFGPTLVGPNSKEIVGYSAYHQFFAFAYYNFTNDVSSSGVFETGGVIVVEDVFQVRPVPSPGSASLLYLGLLGLAAHGRATRRGTS